MVEAAASSDMAMLCLPQFVSSALYSSTSNVTPRGTANDSHFLIVAPDRIISVPLPFPMAYTRCPLWVISRHDGPFASCLLYPQKRTFVSALSMSALCQ